MQLNPKQCTVTLENGTSEAVAIEHLKLREYDRAFKSLDDEMALTAILCGKTKEWVMNLTPASYEALRGCAKAENESGFFAYAERQMAKLTERMNGLRPEILSLVTAKASPITPPGLQPK